MVQRRLAISEQATLSEFKESFAATAAAANVDFSSRQGEAQTHRADIDSDSIKSTNFQEEILPSIDFIKQETLEVTSTKDTDETYVKSISSPKSVNLDKSEFSIPETVSLGISEIAEEHKDDYVDVHRQPVEGDVSTSPKHVSQERIPVQETSKAPYDRSSPTFG
ncbi:uncharacterized protein LOC106176955, partial [Lingula anatina]|uniref:Uncharacterized protein LOC106176955 n=1 Tax=Lingula anatina TaxID=7574 RepID=A0A1S3JY77_LINAN